MSYDNWKLRSDRDALPCDCEPPCVPTDEEQAIEATEQHYRLARESVRLSLSFDRQREQHASYLNQDHVDYLKQCAADARVNAREHIRLAKLTEAKL